MGLQVCIAPYIEWCHFSSWHFLFSVLTLNCDVITFSSTPLTAALNILKGFYEKKAKAALLQTEQPAGPPPPPGFEAYKKNAAAPGVMGMIQQIINDAKAMEAETIRSEEDAQKAYEDFVKDTNASIEEKSKDIVNKSDMKAKAEGELVQATEEKEAVLLELEQLANYKAELHSSCDI